MADYQYGGQAVIEGVMMRGQDSMAVAVRRPDGEIAIMTENVNSYSRRWPVLGLPLLRGLVAMVEMVSLGTRALMFSANATLEEEEEELTRGEMTLSLVVAFGLAILLFMVLPTFAIHWIKELVGGSVMANIAEGLIRVLVLVGYIFAISRMEDIKRVLEYHGAEHKVVHASEAGVDLTPENAEAFSSLHPRCGTSFLLFAVVVSVFVFALFGWPGLWQRILIRVALLPVVIGVSYEMIKASSRFQGTVLSWVTWPGMTLQRLTTGEPDRAQLEVAIAALEAARDTSPSE